MKGKKLGFVHERGSRSRTVGEVGKGLGSWKVWFHVVWAPYWYWGRRCTLAVDGVGFPQSSVKSECV